MAIKMVSYKSTPYGEIRGFVCTATEDVANLPISTTVLNRCDATSTAYVESTGDTYFLSQADTWELDKSGGLVQLSSETTGSAAINKTLFPEEAWRLHEIRLHLSAVGTAGNLVLTLDAGTGAAYDVILLTQAMAGVQDLVWQPEIPIEFGITDKLTITWANATGLTYGLDIMYSVSTLVENTVAQGSTIIVSRTTALTHTTATIGVASGVALAANANRTSALFINDSDTTIYLKVGAAAVLNEGIRLNANGSSYEMSNNYGNLDTRAIYAISSAAAKKLLVTEGS